VYIADDLPSVNDEIGYFGDELPSGNDEIGYVGDESRKIIE